MRRYLSAPRPITTPPHKLRLCRSPPPRLIRRQFRKHAHVRSICLSLARGCARLLALQPSRLRSPPKASAHRAEQVLSEQPLRRPPPGRGARRRGYGRETQPGSWPRRAGQDASLHNRATQEGWQLRAYIYRLVATQAVPQGMQRRDQGRVDSLAIAPAKPPHQIIDPILHRQHFRAQVLGYCHGRHPSSVRILGTGRDGDRGRLCRHCAGSSRQSARKGNRPEKGGH